MFLHEYRQPNQENLTEMWLATIPDETLFRLGKFLITVFEDMEPDIVEQMYDELEEFLNKYKNECNNAEDFESGCVDMKGMIDWIFHEITRRWTNGFITFPIMD